MAKIFFVSLKHDLNEINGGVDRLYGAAGKNLGNLLFTNAVQRQLEWTKMGHGFTFDPVRVNREFDHVVIPAANWLRHGVEMSDLADRVERLTIPITLVGIGAQASGEKGVPKVSPSVLRLVRIIAERSPAIGVRGSFTAGILAHHGIKNVRILGCPSMYMNKSGDYQIRLRRKAERIILAGTRYYLSSDDGSDAYRLQRSVVELAYRQGWDVLFQSERPELDYLITKDKGVFDFNQLKVAAAYYGAESEGAFLRFLDERGRYYLEVDSWFEAMKGYDFYVGSRIHGAIACLLNGTPAFVLAHDSRTSELTRFAGIPVGSIQDLDPLTPEVVKRLYHEVDWQVFIDKMRLARRDYIDFLDGQGLPHCVTPACGVASARRGRRNHKLKGFFEFLFRGSKS